MILFWFIKISYYFYRIDMIIQDMCLRRVVEFGFFIVVILAFSFQELVSQVKYQGTPYYAGNADGISLPVLLDPGMIAREKSASTDPRLKSLKFAHPLKVNLTPYNTGKWLKHENGERIWLAEIESKDAYSLNLIFNNFDPSPGVKVFLYNKSGDFVLGAYTRASHPSSGKFATTPVPGDKVYIEMQVPKNISHFGKISIGTVNHDFLDIYAILKDGRFGRSGDCNTDMACYQEERWKDIKRAVLRILINGNIYCSGALINNTAENGIPYVYTANHCISDSDDAQSSIFYFNYESPSCDGPDGSIDYSISSSVLRATSNKLDFSLVELSTRPGAEYQPYYAGWNLDTENIESAVSIHHPEGDVKKISFEDDAPVTGNFGSDYDAYTHWLVKKWETGTTEPGSSGGPLIDQNNRLIGALTGGEATCERTENDYFSKISHSWDDYPLNNNQLKFWLDPLEINELTLKGYDPYNNYAQLCDTLSNIQSSDTLLKASYIPGFGYITGTNVLNPHRYAEQFSTLTDSSEVPAVFLNPSLLSVTGKTSFISVQLWSGDSIPVEKLTEKNVFLSSLQENSAGNLISFDSTITVTDTFFVVIELSQLAETDTFAINHAANRGVEGENTTFTYDGYNWAPIENFNTALAIYPQLCGSIQSNIPSEPRLPVADFLVYPNPASDLLNINLNLEKPEPVYFRIVNLSGSIVSESLVEYSPEKQIDISNLDSGLYILHIFSDNFFAEKKIVIAR